MNTIKKEIKGNLAMGIMSILIGCLNVNKDYLAVIIFIVFLIILFFSFRLLRSIKNLLEEYKDSWIYRVLGLLKLCGIIILISSIKYDFGTDMILIICGLLYLFEAGYWSYILRKKPVIDN